MLSVLSAKYNWLIPTARIDTFAYKRQSRDTVMLIRQGIPLANGCRDLRWARFQDVCGECPDVGWISATRTNVIVCLVEYFMKRGKKRWHLFEKPLVYSFYPPTLGGEGKRTFSDLFRCKFQKKCPPRMNLAGLVCTYNICNLSWK